MCVAAHASFTCVFRVNLANEKLFSSLNHSCSNDADIDTADADVSSIILYFFKLQITFASHSNMACVLILW